VNWAEGGAAMSRVYLDHNATSSMRPEASRAVREALDAPAGNPSSLHAEGREARRAVEQARERVAGLVGLSSRDVVFTSGGSEAISTALRGVCESTTARRRRMVVSSVEHSAVLDTAAALARRGFEVESVACHRDGRVDADEFLRRLSGDVCVAALQWANNETGVIQPVEEVARGCAGRGIPLLVDAVQAAGKIEIDPRRSEIALLAVSGHKLGGPQGTGALFVSPDLSLAPLVAGGAQERRRRGGTEAVALIAGFGAAAEAARTCRKDEAAHLLRLRVRIESRLRDRFDGVEIHGEGRSRLPNTVNFSLPGVPGETLAIALDVAGFSVSTGSACAAGSVKPSHVLLAMGYDDARAREAVRVSLGWSTTADEVESFLDALPDLVGQVRRGLDVHSAP
jgi:cysteine desulfurase